MQTRICSQCGNPRPLDQYAIERGQPRANCKFCDRGRKKEWARRRAADKRMHRLLWESMHPEEVAAARRQKEEREQQTTEGRKLKQREEYEQNRSRHIARAMNNYHANRPDRLLKMKAYRLANPAKLREIQKRWRATHREQIKLRRARLRGTWRWWFASRWKSINQRTVNGARPRWHNRRDRRYLDKGVELQMTRREFYGWCCCRAGQIEAMMREGERPSIDRSDPAGHYALDNLQVIPLALNSLKDCRHRNI